MVRMGASIRWSCSGEGAIAFVVKRLEDAEAAGDRIYAVIRGLGCADDPDTAAERARVPVDAEEFEGDEHHPLTGFTEALIQKEEDIASYLDTAWVVQIIRGLALAAILGPGIDNLVIAISVVGWVGYARLARAQALSLKQREHVTAAVALGSRQGRIILRHIIPLMLAPLLVEASFGIAAVIVAEAGLSFLGLGVQPPQASWGSMIREGADFLLVAPHLAIFPGIAIFLVVLSANLFGDWLRSRLDVRDEVARA